MTLTDLLIVSAASAASAFLGAAFDWRDLAHRAWYFLRGNAVRCVLCGTDCRSTKALMRHRREACPG